MIYFWEKGITSLNKTTVMAYFKLYGENFDPEEITNKLLIQPTETGKKGERGKYMILKKSYWEVSTDYEVSLDINDQLRKIVNLLKDKKDVIVDLQNSLGLECKFQLVIMIRNEQTPACYLEKEMIHFASSINAFFDFDMYVV